ncbi:hypothetical protein BCF11_2313 [Collimonas sp. PA-H2]|uniref:hypothetical protein n=1 Tax=Collimonas sp. PA-H2 TaxID=1881062 RepID=UPI000C014ED5|nr:hypothetical protein [Collimonas sp. PA-H2]PFH09908.1 hypothetical protein BCF11_2313 [Collimonas sp. PA-H2]
MKKRYIRPARSRNTYVITNTLLSIGVLLALLVVVLLAAKNAHADEVKAGANDKFSPAAAANACRPVTLSPASGFRAPASGLASRSAPCAQPRRLHLFR